MKHEAKNFKWLDEVGNIIDAIQVGAPTYAGSYKIVYFPNFRVLAYMKNGKWRLSNKFLPDHIRGAYQAANYLKV